MRGNRDINVCMRLQSSFNFSFVMFSDNVTIGILQHCECMCFVGSRRLLALIILLMVFPSVVFVYCFLFILCQFFFLAFYIRTQPFDFPRRWKKKKINSFDPIKKLMTVFSVNYAIRQEKAAGFATHSQSGDSSVYSTNRNSCLLHDFGTNGNKRTKQIETGGRGSFST